jgi:hypothetical protein
MSPLVKKTNAQCPRTEPMSERAEKRKSSLLAKENESALTSLHKEEDAMSSQTVRKTSTTSTKGSLRNRERVMSDSMGVSSQKSLRNSTLLNLDEESAQTKKGTRKEIAVFKPPSSFKDKDFKRIDSIDEKFVQNVEEKFQALMDSLEEYGKAKGLPLRAEKESLKRAINSVLKKH